jgi:hypothetical protein
MVNIAFSTPKFLVISIKKPPPNIPGTSIIKFQDKNKYVVEVEICGRIQPQEGHSRGHRFHANNIPPPKIIANSILSASLPPCHLRDLRYALLLCASSPHGIRKAASATRSHPPRFTPKRVTSHRSGLTRPRSSDQYHIFHIPPIRNHSSECTTTSSGRRWRAAKRCPRSRSPSRPHPQILAWPRSKTPASTRG